MGTKRTVALNVVRLSTGEVVRTVDVREKTETQIERVWMGILRNMDLDHYSVRAKEEDV